MNILSTIKLVQPFAIGAIFIAIYLAEHIYPQRKDLIDNRHDVYNIFIGV